MDISHQIHGTVYIEMMDIHSLHHKNVAVFLAIGSKYLYRVSEEFRSHRHYNTSVMRVRTLDRLDNAVT